MSGLEEKMRAEIFRNQAYRSHSYSTKSEMKGEWSLQGKKGTRQSLMHTNT